MQLSSTTDLTEDSAPPLRSGTRASLRVLLVLEATGKGTGKHIMDLSEGLLAKGCEVHLLYSPIRMDDMFRTRMSSMRGLVHRAIPMYRGIHLSDLSATRAVRRYLRRNGRFDVIHGHSSKGGAIARLAAIGTGVPAIYTPHALFTMTPGLPAWKRRFFDSTEYMLSKLSRFIIAVSPAEARLAAATGLGESRIVTIPNGVDPPRLSMREEARARCGVGPDEIVIGSVGRLVVNKAPDVLIKAVALALRSYPDLRVVILGDGPLKPSLPALAEELNISRCVRLLGEVDASSYFAAFDIFAISSRMESMPYVILEAMAAGLPVVATETSGIETLVDDGFNGLVVAMDDCEAFAAALVDLATDRQKRTQMGRASLNRVAAFSSQRMIERIFELYKSCVWRPEPQENEDDELQLAGDME